MENGYAQVKVDFSSEYFKVARAFRMTSSGAGTILEVRAVDDTVLEHSYFVN